MNPEMMRQEETRKLMRWGMWALIVLTVFLGVKALAALKDLKNPPLGYNSISVNGEGKAQVTPDIATFSFSVEATAKTAPEAQAAVTPKMDAAIQALRDLGIEDKDIDTSNYNVYEKFNYVPLPCTPMSCPPSRQVSEGFVASHNVTVKVRNKDNAGQALAAVTAKGATNISGITFTVDDPEAAEMEARREAIENAKAKAEELADSLDVRLVRLVGYYDNDRGDYPMPMYYDSFKTESAAVGAAPSLPVGERDVNVMVTLTYEIR